MGETHVGFWWGNLKEIHIGGEVYIGFDGGNLRERDHL